MRAITTPETNTVLTLSDDKGERIPDGDLPALRFLGYDATRGETEKHARQMWRTFWMPTEAEAAKLEAGAPVELTIIGQGHPPVSVGVGDAVVPEREMIDRSHVDRALGLLYAQLRELAELAIAQMWRENVPSTALHLPGADDTPNPEAVGLPGPNQLADLWLKAVEETRQRPDSPTMAPLAQEVDHAIGKILSDENGAPPA